MKLTKKEMLDELSYFYKSEVLQNLDTFKKISSFFLDHVESHLEEISPAELYENDEFHEAFVLIDTPDGFFSIGDFVKKHRDCLFLTTENGKTVECSVDHLIETNNGWKLAKDLSSFDKIITDTGFSYFLRAEILPYQAVYDFEVNSDNHRYWTLNGISSHNTAKTFMACYAALDLLKEGSHKKIILARPAVEAGENLGFLPGTVDEKLAPYMEGYISNMEKILENTDKLKALIGNKIIDMQPLAFMRSRTFDDTILILDEAQNADLRQIMLVVTRMGINSRIVICGDVTQWDLKARRGDLLKFSENIVNDVEDCASFEFKREDIVRNPILVKLTDKYEEYKEKEGLL